MEAACLANYSGGKELPHCIEETFTLVYSPHEEEENTTTDVGHREISCRKRFFLEEHPAYGAEKKSFRDILLFPWKYANSHLPERSHTHGFLFKAREEGEGRKSFHVLV